MKDAFREEEAGGQFAIVSGSAEGDGDGAGVHADFEGFFDGQLVFHRAGGSAE